MRIGKLESKSESGAEHMVADFPPPGANVKGMLAVRRDADATWHGRRLDWQPGAPISEPARSCGLFNLEKAVETTKDTNGTKGEGLAELGFVIWRVSYSDVEPPRLRPLFSGFSCFSCLSWFNPTAVSKFNTCQAGDRRSGGSFAPLPARANERWLRLKPKRQARRLRPFIVHPSQRIRTHPTGPSCGGINATLPLSRHGKTKNR